MVKTKESINYRSKLISELVWRIDPHGAFTEEQTDLVIAALTKCSTEALVASYNAG